jgi:hypothetical protein
MAKLFFALMACLLVGSCLGASNHISNDVPKKICDKNSGWQVFKMKNNNFSPPMSNAMAQHVILTQMQTLAPQLLKEAAAKYNQPPSNNAKWLNKFGTQYSWALDGCMKVRKKRKNDRHPPGFPIALQHKI